jgi:hypothetical protein
VATAPSIKGSVFEVLVGDVNRLLERDPDTREKATNWLQPGDFELLGTEVLVSSWYPIESYTRLSLLLRDVEGRGRNEYLRRMGRATARRLLDAGLYAQLEYLHRVKVVQESDPLARFTAFGRDLRMLCTMSGSILNFSRWTPHPDGEHEGRYVIEVTEAEHFPEVLCWRSEGFVNEMASQHGQEDLWHWERPAPDRVVFRMTRPA